MKNYHLRIINKYTSDLGYNEPIARTAFSMKILWYIAWIQKQPSLISLHPKQKKTTAEKSKMLAIKGNKKVSFWLLLGLRITKFTSHI